MLNRIKSYLRSDEPLPERHIPPGERVYAIGDIHGRIDLLEELASAIEADDAASPPAETTVILLGDLVDRGPDSAAVVDFAREWQDRRDVRILAGNHEEMLLASLTNTDLLRHFLRFGGRETLLSYGMDPEFYRTASLEEITEWMVMGIPDEDIAFIQQMEDSIVIGDYLFVHAGIRPEIALSEQKVTDLRWIREPFLSHEGEHPHIVVHGHTITPGVDIRSNRIGIDTGAYCHGRLTALVLEGSQRRFLEAVIPANR